jgi:hypothetical protein
LIMNMFDIIPFSAATLFLILALIADRRPA